MGEEGLATILRKSRLIDVIAVIERGAIEETLEREDFRVLILPAGAGVEADHQRFLEIRPDICVLIIDLALAAARPDIPIIALAAGDAASDVIACADAGFASYVLRDAPISRLREIIDMAIRGEVVCSPKISGGLLRELRLRRTQSQETEANDPLTRRECDVLRLLARGLSNKEIARHLTLSEATIKNHVHEVLGKLHVRRRAEAMVRVRDRPWIANIGILA
jgi:DNA-binding NarL/FixJ family response regulator